MFRDHDLIACAGRRAAGQQSKLGLGLAGANPAAAGDVVGHRDGTSGWHTVTLLGAALAS